MSWTSRFHAPTGRIAKNAAGAFAAAFALALTAPAFARASAGTPTLWFAGTRLILAETSPYAGDLVIASDDPGLDYFLQRLGATIAWSPGQNYVVITTADRRTITFTLGDSHVMADGARSAIAFAPYVVSRRAYVPFYAVARALYVDPIVDARDVVLQPQIGALDVRSERGKTVVVLRGAMKLHFTRADSGNRTQLTFDGIASTLAPTRSVEAPGLSEIDVRVDGTPRHPQTTVTLVKASSTDVSVSAETAGRVALVVSGTGGSVAANTAVASGAVPSQAAAEAPGLPAGPDLGPASAAAPAAPAVPGAPVAPAATAATVTSVDSQMSDGAFEVAIRVTGNADYEWHRLADDRYYVDIHGATLAFATREDEPAAADVRSIRIKQFSPSPNAVVRVSLTLSGEKRIDPVAVDGGLTLRVTDAQADADERVGYGKIGPSAAEVAQATGPQQQALVPSDWKFGPVNGNALPAGRNARLIVLDPGHGGSDTGAMHNGLTEKDLTLDIAERLRTKLVAAGFLVKMTRDHDNDVFAANDSARDELQARCDVANSAGAGLFISIHINSFTSSGLSGTTTYYYKPEDRAWAEVVHKHLASLLQTKDDGVRRENFYVVRHTTMPATLVETAFLSNPDDAQLLRSPEFLEKVARGLTDAVVEYNSMRGIRNPLETGAL